MSRIFKITAALLTISVLVGGVIVLAQSNKQPPTELYVRTVPSGAEVLIDGKRVGTSNDLFEVKPGTRKVEVKLDGYEPAEKEAIVAATRIERVEFELEKLAGDGRAVVASGSTEAGNGPTFIEVLRKAKTEYDSLVLAYEKKDWPVVDKHANELSDLLEDEIMPAFKLQDYRDHLKKMKPGENKKAVELALQKAERMHGEIKSYQRYVKYREMLQTAMRMVVDYGDDLHDSIRDGKISQAPDRYAALQKAWEALWKVISERLPQVEMHFVRLVIGKDRMTFEGKDVTWEELPGLLEKVPEKNQTVLELALATDEISIKRENDSKGKAVVLAHQFGFKYLSYIGVHPLGSKGSPSQIVKPTTTNILTNPGAEDGDTTPNGWKQGTYISGVKYSWDKKVAYRGKASLCIEKTAQRYFPIASWSQTVERKGDAEAVELSAQVKAEKMTKAVLDMVFLDKNDKWISHKWAAYIGSKEKDQPPATHDWKRYAGKVDVPPGTVKVIVGLQVYGPGKVWFDDVRLVEAKENGESATSVDGSKAAREEMIALVEDFFHHNFRDVTSRKTLEWGDVKKHPNGNRSISYKYLATFHQNPEKVVVNQVFTFDKDGKFVDYENVEGPEGEGKAKDSATADDAKVLRRKVGKKLADFPEAVDLSTPESAWAAYHRASGRQDAKAIVELSWVKAMLSQIERSWKQAEPEGLAIYNKAQLEAECVEVLSYGDDLADVISRLPFPPGKGRHPYSLRSFGLIDGEWKNLGEDRCPTLEAARAAFEKKKDVIRKHFHQIRDKGQTTWEPVIERVVNEEMSKQGNQFIDFDTGKVFAPPKPGSNQTLEKWIADTGIDAIGGTRKGIQGLVGIEMIVFPAENQFWDMLPAEKVTDNAVFARGKAGTPIYISGQGKLPTTHIFKTREGGRGILQIVGFVDKPSGVKIRYKLVKQTKEAK
ncbi:MAG: PEGA domain-containing protein [Pirellulales bacterium]|nr:PEGA domain-containing protein [Pirellulales bacterium]